MFGRQIAFAIFRTAFRPIAEPAAGRNVPVFDNDPSTYTDTGWILAYGSWDDSKVWMDSETFNTNP